MTSECQSTARKLISGEISAFSYLRIANSLLSNPAQEKDGRELIIRALENKGKFYKHNEILKNLVRKSGLFPYLNSEFENKTIDEEFLIETYRSTYSKNFILHSMQHKLFNTLLEGKNVILSAPTSMGKSVIVDSIIASNKFKKIVLVVPTIALIDETRRRITKEFEASYEVIYHNSQRSRKRKTIYILTQERVNEREDINNIDLFVIDEFYKLAFKKDTDERATSLNIALSKLLLVSKQFFMIGPNIDNIRGIDKISNGYFFIPSDFNTVAVDVHEYEISANNITNKNKCLEKIVKPSNITSSEQIIIYCKSPASAADVARKLIDIGATKEFSSPYTHWTEKNYSKKWIYSEAINSGIGIHHGALPRAIQQQTIDLFNNKAINFLICTSTIIEGVNTVAENVVIYDNRNGVSSIDRFTHNNIKGRAGRMKVHFVGKVHCLEKIPPQTMESRVVDVPLGLQDNETAYNMIAGIQPEHIDDEIKGDYESFMEKSKIPQELFKKHATYKIESIRSASHFVDDLSDNEIKYLCEKQIPKEESMEIVCAFIKQTEISSLRRLNLAFDGSDELRIKINNYLYSHSQQDYLSKRIKWIEETDKNNKEKSNLIDRELKIIRNVFCYTIPKSISLLEDVINHVCKERNLDYQADFGAFIAIFENSHLPGNLSALEEMGIPNQTLNKLELDRLKSRELNTLIRYLRWNFRKIENLTEIDRHFISRALT